MPITVKMNCNQLSSKVFCSFWLHNNGKNGYYILKRNTPLEGLQYPFIDISNTAGKLSYKGMSVYRLPPIADDFILLEGGNTVFTSVEVTAAYEFDKDGFYTVQYNHPLMYASEVTDPLRELPLNEITSLEVMNAGSLTKTVGELIMNEVIDYSSLVSYDLNIEARCSSPFFKGGLKKQHLDTLKAHENTCVGYNKAAANVDKNPTLYTKWFGARNSNRVAKVKKTISMIQNKLAGTVVYDFTGSGCNPGGVAYTYWPNHNTVYFCSGYNSITAISCTAVTGDHSKQGVLAHEWSHTGAGTKDTKYGVPGSEELAKSSPDDAVENADNYRYFHCESYKNV